MVEDLPHVIIFGTRTFNDYELLKTKMDLYTASLGKIVVCTGEWRGIGYGTPEYIGADLLGEQWAHHLHHPVLQFPPEFHKHGTPAAFHIRNREMVEYVAERREGFAVGFWDGKSTGTKSVRELLRKHNIPTKMVRY